MTHSTASLQLETLDTQALADCLTNCTLAIYDHADYETTHQAMLNQTLQKIEQKKAGKYTADELWLVEHQDVYTLGQAGKKEHILFDNGTPIIQTDRGGQVTWHGAGQLVVYFLFDLNALGWGVRDLVSHAEQAIEDTLNHYLPSHLVAKARKDAPGVYIYAQEQMLGKIASLGFKIKHGHSYHGIAINLRHDPAVFLAINPCGYAGMSMLRLCDLAPFDDQTLIIHLLDNLNQRRLGKISLRH